MKNNTNQITILICSIFSIFVYGCSKPQPLSCESQSVKSQLLGLISENQLNSNLISESIIKTQAKEEQDDHLECIATVRYSHNLFANRKLDIMYIYQINPSNQVKDVTYLTAEEEKKFQNWFLDTPNIISYQKSRYGILAVVQPHDQRSNNQHNQTQQLSFNNTKIELGNNESDVSITIDKKFISNNNNSEIFIITAYPNQAKQLSSYQNYIVSIESANKFEKFGPFIYQESSIQQKSDMITFAGIKEKPYSEPNDYPLYRFQNNQLTEIRKVKPDSYYQKKFSHLSPEQIIKQVKADGCLNGDQFYLSDICRSKSTSYCFKFNSIANPTKGPSYWLLKNLCQTDQ